MYTDTRAKHSCSYTLIQNGHSFCKHYILTFRLIYNYHQDTYDDCISSILTMTVYYTVKIPQACCKLSILLACCNLSTSCNQLVNSIKLQPKSVKGAVSYFTHMVLRVTNLTEATHPFSQKVSQQAVQISHDMSMK